MSCTVVIQSTAVNYSTTTAILAGFSMRTGRSAKRLDLSSVLTTVKLPRHSTSIWWIVFCIRLRLHEALDLIFAFGKCTFLLPLMHRQRMNQAAWPLMIMSPPRRSLSVAEIMMRTLFGRLWLQQSGDTSQICLASDGLYSAEGASACS